MNHCKDVCRNTYVVEEVVGTSQLLEGLQGHTQADTVEHARRSEEFVPLLAAGFGLELVLDLVELLEDDLVVLRHTVQLGHGGTGLVDAAVAEVKTRRLGEESHTTTEDDGEQEGQTESDTPLGSTLQGVGTQVDEVGQEDTEGDEQLVATDHGTTDVTGGTLTLVHGDEQGASTNTQTSGPTTHDHLDPFSGGGGDLDDQADHEDNTPEGDGPLAADLVGDGGSDESTDQGTNRQKTGQETGADVTQVPFALSVLHTIAAEIVGFLLETGDLTSVITEEETTHGDEDGHDEGPQGHAGNRGVNTAKRLLERLLAGVLLGSDRRGDVLPVVKGGFDTHGGHVEDVLFVCQWGRMPSQRQEKRK